LNLCKIPPHLASNKLNNLLVITGALKLKEWTMHEWTITADIAEVDIAGVDNDRVIDSEFKL